MNNVDQPRRRGQAKVENLEELITAARSYDPEEVHSFDAGDGGEEDAAAEQTVLDQFLGHAALESGESQSDPHQDCVQMMTLHSAKGLEFPLVFLSGLEDGLFPHQMSMDEPGRLEEERRLCYVGITRAMKQLYITYAESRRINGSETYNRLSRFVTEIPKDLIQEIRLNTVVTKPAYAAPVQRSRLLHGDVEGTNLKLGQRIAHSKFGEGVILNYEGEGKQARVHVNFDSEGSKWLMLSYANLLPM